jgi:hypothetical protein
MRSGMKSFLDEVDASVAKWQALLDSVNTAEDSSFVTLTAGTFCTWL